MKNVWIDLGWALLGMGLAPAIFAAPTPQEFHRAVYALHLKQTTGQAIRTEEESGAYEGVAGRGYRYRVTRYYDVASGRLLSRLQRDAERDDAIHIAEVNVYDDAGRLVRDYLSSAPPWRPASPTHAYVNLHHYNGRLHSFRQFELDGRVNYEACQGEYNGKRVRIAHDADDRTQAIVSSPAYRACFDGLRDDWSAWVSPR